MIFGLLIFGHLIFGLLIFGHLIGFQHEHIRPKIGGGTMPYKSKLPKQVQNIFIIDKMSMQSKLPWTEYKIGGTNFCNVNTLVWIFFPILTNMFHLYACERRQTYSIWKLNKCFGYLIWQKANCLRFYAIFYLCRSLRILFSDSHIFAQRIFFCYYFLISRIFVLLYTRDTYRSLFRGLSLIYS